MWHWSLRPWAPDKIFFAIFFLLSFFFISAVPAERITAEKALIVLKIIYSGRMDQPNISFKGDLTKKIKGLVRPYVGCVRYHWGGIDPKTGLDCSAFTQLLFKKLLGTNLLPRTVRQQSKIGQFIPAGALKAGDLAFFDGDKKKMGADHVAIVIDNDHFVHCVSPIGAIISQFSEYPHPVKFGRRIIY